MTPTDIAAMAEFVARAIYETTGAEEPWPDLADAEKADFLLCAHAAMGAHDAWLKVGGYAVVRLEKGKPPGHAIMAPKPKRLLDASGRPVN